MWLSLVLACASPIVEAPPVAEVPVAAPPAAPVSLDALKAAAAQDPKRGEAQYALALGLADARAAKRACDDEAWLRAVVDAVGAAVAADGSYREKAKTEHKFAEARATLEFWQAVDGPLDDAALLAHLPGVTLFPPAAGVFGNQAMAVIAADGALTYRTMTDPDHPTVFAETKGRWSLKGRVLTLELGEGRTETVTFGKELQFEGGMVSDFPSECEA